MIIKPDISSGKFYINLHFLLIVLSKHFANSMCGEKKLCEYIRIHTLYSNIYDTVCVIPTHFLIYTLTL